MSSTRHLAHCFKRQLTLCTIKSVSRAAFLLEQIKIHSRPLRVPILDNVVLQTTNNYVWVSYVISYSLTAAIMFVFLSYVPRC